MLQVNCRAAGLPPPQDINLEVVRVIGDGRILPHEWVRLPDGNVMKVAATSHGADHFLPGPTDIAWDVPGAIVEWDLRDGAREQLITRYAQHAGDHIAPRLPAYVIAYAAFRFGCMRMASSALAARRDHDGSSARPYAAAGGGTVR